MFDKAIEAYKNVFQLSLKRQNFITISSCFQSKLEEAKHIKGFSLKPDYAGVYYNIGVALGDQEKLDEAIDAYKKAILLKPDYAEAYNNLGNISHDQDKLEKSIEAFKKALLFKPDMLGLFQYWF